MGLTHPRTPVVKFTAAWGGVFNFNSDLKPENGVDSATGAGASKLLFLNLNSQIGIQSSIASWPVVVRPRRRSRRKANRLGPRGLVNMSAVINSVCK